MTISFGALAAANRPLPIRAVTPTLLCTASRLMAVPIDQGATFHAGNPRPLFDGIYNSGSRIGAELRRGPQNGSHPARAARRLRSFPDASCESCSTGATR